MSVPLARLQLIRYPGVNLEIYWDGLPQPVVVLNAEESATCVPYFAPGHGLIRSRLQVFSAGKCIADWWAVVDTQSVVRPPSEGQVFNLSPWVFNCVCLPYHITQCAWRNSSSWIWLCDEMGLALGTIVGLFLTQTNRDNRKQFIQAIKSKQPDVSLVPIYMKSIRWFWCRYPHHVLGHNGIQFSKYHFYVVFGMHQELETTLPHVYPLFKPVHWYTIPWTPFLLAYTLAQLYNHPESPFCSIYKKTWKLCDTRVKAFHKSTRRPKAIDMSKLPPAIHTMSAEQVHSI